MHSWDTLNCWKLACRWGFPVWFIKGRVRFSPWGVTLRSYMGCPFGCLSCLSWWWLKWVGEERSSLFSTGSASDGRLDFAYLGQLCRYCQCLRQTLKFWNLATLFTYEGLLDCFLFCSIFVLCLPVAKVQALFAALRKSLVKGERKRVGANTLGIRGVVWILTLLCKILTREGTLKILVL